jgi:hypothetical protein
VLCELERRGNEGFLTGPGWLPCLQEMASRHRVRAPCLQIIKTATVPAAMTKRANIKQFHDSKIKFPLTRRLARHAISMPLCACLCVWIHGCRALGAVT